MSRASTPTVDHVASLARIFELAASRAASSLAECSAHPEWAVLGIGKSGLKAAAILRARGRRVAFFVDAKSEPGMVVDGAPAYRKEDVPALLKSTPVLAAIHNPQYDSWSARQELLAAGFPRVHLLQEAVEAFHELSHFWLAPARETLGYRFEAFEGLERLADEASKSAYCAILAFRLLGERCPMPEPDQYFPSTVPRAPEPLRWVDCGAFDGDTLDFVAGSGLACEWSAAFEPDPENYAKLAAKHARASMLIPCGVSDRMGMAHFLPDGPSGALSGRSEEGISIQLASLDCALGPARVNFLKMDIEGAELMALDGAARLVSTCQPRLAIACYHAPRHLWEVAAKACAIGFGGKFMLRIHAHNTFDAVLYGIEATTPIDHQEQA